MKTKTIGLTFILCLAAGAFCLAADDPMMGTWKLNEAKSKIAPGAPKNSTVVYAAAGDQIKVTVDGTDVPASYAACQEAVARARRGDGPTLIDAKVWRMNSHTSEDNHLKYRGKDEIDEAASHDPIARFSTWLLERRWLTAEEAAAIQAECDREASDAADWAERQPDPVAEEAMKNVFA